MSQDCVTALQPGRQGREREREGERERGREGEREGRRKEGRKKEREQVLQFLVEMNSYVVKAVLELLGSSDLSASQSTWLIGMSYHTWLIFCIFSRDVFHHVGQAGLELLTS